jgi:hypothetical protein
MLPPSTPPHITDTPVPVRLFAFVAAACTLAACVLHNESNLEALQPRVHTTDVRHQP